MRLDIDQLVETTTVTISGNEQWLRGVYTAFPTPKGRAEPKLTGTLKVSAYRNESLTVDGSLNYEPYIDCSRCAEPIQWPLNPSINVEYRHRSPSDLPREHNLSKEELDHYHFDADRHLDVEALVNEFIHLSIPMKIIRRTTDGSSCLVCAADLTEDVVFQDQREPTKANPFEVLQQLKNKN